MTLGSRERASWRTSLGPIALMACAIAMAVGLPLWRGSASGAKPDERGPKPGNPAATHAPTPAAGARTEVHALAQLAPEGGTIVVGVRPGTRIERIAVKEGDQVSAGAMLAVLEGHAQAQLQVALAEAQKKSADLQRTRGRDKLAVERQREDALKKERLDAQEKLVDLAKRRVKAATEIYQKIGKPLQDNPAQRHELDLGYYQADAESIKAHVELKELQVGQDLIARRRAVEDQSLADGGPESDVLDRQIELARVALDQTIVVAPLDGRILEVTAHAGEVSSGPLLSLGDLSAMVAIAEVYQADVREVKVGDPAEVLILGKNVAGKVTRLSRLVGRNSLASLDPRALQDRRIVPITIHLSEPAAAADYVNMEVEVTIRPQHGGGPR